MPGTGRYGVRVYPGLDRILPSPRPTVAPPRTRIYYNGGANTSASEATSEGTEDVPTLEWSASQPTAVVTLPAMGYKLVLPDDGSDDDDGFQFETFRITHDERIVGDDGESFVDVEVVDSIGFQNRTSLVRKFELKNSSRSGG